MCKMRMLLRMKIRILPTHAISLGLKAAGTAGMVQALYLDRRLVRPWLHFLPTHVHVRYMLSPVRLSSVCLSSVTLVYCTEVGKIFGNISTAFDSTMAIH